MKRVTIYFKFPLRQMPAPLPSENKTYAAPSPSIPDLNAYAPTYMPTQKITINATMPVQQQSDNQPPSEPNQEPDNSANEMATLASVAAHITQYINGGALLPVSKIEQFIKTTYPHVKFKTLHPAAGNHYQTKFELWLNDSWLNAPAQGYFSTTC